MIILGEGDMVRMSGCRGSAGSEETSFASFMSSHLSGSLVLIGLSIQLFCASMLQLSLIKEI
jgi:hypothetical protein